MGNKEGLTVRSDPVRCEDLVMTDQTGLVERTSVDGPAYHNRRNDHHARSKISLAFSETPTWSYIKASIENPVRHEKSTRQLT